MVNKTNAAVFVLLPDTHIHSIKKQVRQDKTKWKRIVVVLFFSFLLCHNFQQKLLAETANLARVNQQMLQKRGKTYIPEGVVDLLRQSFLAGIVCVCCTGVYLVESREE